MNDRPIIIAGVIVFLLVVTFPVWYNVAARTTAAAPPLARPSVAGMSRLRGGDRSVSAPPSCIAPLGFMRASHMRLLVQWQDDVVRRNDRTYVAADGRRYDKSLAATCWTCHDDKAGFCDRCHDYAGATVRCGDCHLTK